MTRAPAFACLLLTGLSLILALENRAVRADQQAMKTAYEAFLKKKAGAVALEARIQPGTLAVFKTARGMVGCALMK